MIQQPAGPQVDGLELAADEIRQALDLGDDVLGSPVRCVPPRSWLLLVTVQSHISRSNQLGIRFQITDSSPAHPGRAPEALGVDGDGDLRVEDLASIDSGPRRRRILQIEVTRIAERHAVGVGALDLDGDVHRLEGQSPGRPMPATASGSCIDPPAMPKSFNNCPL